MITLVQGYIFFLQFIGKYNFKKFGGKYEENERKEGEKLLRREKGGEKEEKQIKGKNYDKNLLLQGEKRYIPQSVHYLLSGKNSILERGGGGKNKIFWGNIYRWKKPENMWQTRIPTDSPLWKDP